MSRFYGVVNGMAKKAATRRGGKALRTVAASWNGCISVELYLDAAGNECAKVQFERWQGTGTCGLLYEGPINPDNVDSAVGPESRAFCFTCAHGSHWSPALAEKKGEQ